MNDRRITFLLGFITLAAILTFVTGKQIAHDPIRATVLVMAFMAVTAFLFVGINTKGLSSYQSTYYLSFILVCALTWSPFKALAYLSPMLVLGLFIMREVYNKDSGIIKKLMVLILYWSCFCLLHGALNNRFETSNAFICFFTYSSFFPLFLLSSKRLSNPELLQRICLFLAPILFIEAVIGIAQGFYGIASWGGLKGPFGDYVEGTLDLHPMPKRSLNNPMYAFNMSVGIMALYILGFSQNKFRRIILFCLCIFAFILSSVLHLVMVFIPLLFGGLLLANAVGNKKRIGPLATLVIIGSFVTAIMLATLGANMGLDKRIENIQAGRNQKFKVIDDFLNLGKEDPKVILIGAGPGQYASRAALISAGYLGALPPGLQFKSASYFQEHLLDEWVIWFGSWWRSASNSPGSSWLALSSEFGLPSFLLIILSIALYFRSILRICNDQNYILCGLQITGVLYIFFTSFIEMYWEVPQAIFMGCLLLKLMHARIYYPNEETHLEDSI